MKKLLILILIILLLVLVFIVGWQGFGIGKIQVLGLQGIQGKSAELDEKIQEAGKLAQKDFKESVDDVESTAKELESKKEEYLALLPQNAEDGTQTLPTLKRYEIETLWVKIGNHATSEGTVIKMDVVQGGANIETPETQDSTNAEVEAISTNTTTNSNLEYSYYDLKFTVNGSYIAITDFISDIENDDELGFKIEEFKLVPSGSGSELQATFTCKDILIKKVDQTPIQTTQNQDGNNTNNTNSSNTNSANTNNTANNTTNSTNTTNATNN